MGRLMMMIDGVLSAGDGDGDGDVLMLAEINRNQQEMDKINQWVFVNDHDDHDDILCSFASR